MILQRRRCREFKIAQAWFKDHSSRMRRTRGAVCNAAVTFHWSVGPLGLFHSMRRLVSGGGCICQKLRQKSGQFAHRYAGGAVMYRNRNGDLIDMLMWIRRIHPNVREHDVKAVEVIE
jgi:hypothetical protein